jgi:Spy/CpxP family protein refolding chaperone
MNRLLTLACALLFTTAALAGTGGKPMGRAGMGARGMGGHGMGLSMERNLFPPALVLTNQVALGLTEAQVASIKSQVSETQGRVLDAQVDLTRVSEQLRTALEPTKVDEAAALNLASQAMDLEKKVKTAQLSLMIQVKNVLTQEQQEKARALKAERRAGHEDDINH